MIHSSRSVGFTGWIGGVAVFDRVLSAAELASLAALANVPEERAKTPPGTALQAVPGGDGSTQ